MDFIFSMKELCAEVIFINRLGGEDIRFDLAPDVV